MNHRTALILKLAQNDVSANIAHAENLTDAIDYVNARTSDNGT